MIRIDCPFCGPRDEVEFAYRGEAGLHRPDGEVKPEAMLDFVHKRCNPRGWHRELWHHVGGCRQVLEVERDTLTHAVRRVAPLGTPR
jgi:sarcosine oxidase subunit delta